MGLIRFGCIRILNATQNGHVSRRGPSVYPGTTALMCYLKFGLLLGGGETQISSMHYRKILPCRQSSKLYFDCYGYILKPTHQTNFHDNKGS